MNPVCSKGRLNVSDGLFTACSKHDFVFHFGEVHNKLAVEIAHMVFAGKHAAGKGVVGGHVGGMNQSHKIVITRNFVAVRHARLFQNRTLEGFLNVVWCLPFQLRPHEHVDAAPHGLGRNRRGLPRMTLVSSMQAMRRWQVAAEE